MSENFSDKENLQTQETAQAEVSESNNDLKKAMDFKFFKSCSASLKRFSIILFVINIFFTITLVGVGVVLLAVYIGVEMLALLALPVFTVSVILVLIARFISAMVYGFAEIVEKHEKE